MATHTYTTARPAVGDPASTSRSPGGTITGGGAVVVVVEDGFSKTEVLLALEAVKAKITAATWPPTGA